jgi:hypothetical protein
MTLHNTSAIKKLMVFLLKLETVTIIEVVTDFFGSGIINQAKCDKSEEGVHNAPNVKEKTKH